MRKIHISLILSVMVLLLNGLTANANPYEKNPNYKKDYKLFQSLQYGFRPFYRKGHNEIKSVQLGPRPFYLVDSMDESDLKEKLKQCSKRPFFYKSEFSIGHRGAAMQFPEHTKESYIAAARMGAGIVECDVTFTQDKELVCRHAQCDLHTTTNILATPLAETCRSQPDFNAEYPFENVECCTSDITLAEFKSLNGKMDAGNRLAKTLDEYMNATAAWRTDLYATNGTLLSHAESIDLFKQLRVKMTPELKAPQVPMPFDGFSQHDYAQKLIDEYKAAHVAAHKVYPQSFNLDDVLYWIDQEPGFGKQAVYLDGRYDNPAFDHTDPNTWIPTMEDLVDDGVKIIAPPMWMLLALDADNEVVPSVYANEAKAAGLKIITWTLERSGPLQQGGGWYYQTTTDATNNDGDMLQALHVLAKQVGILGIFSDWPATTTFYANCMGLK